MKAGEMRPKTPGGAIRPTFWRRELVRRGRARGVGAETTNGLIEAVLASGRLREAPVDAQTTGHYIAEQLHDANVEVGSAASDVHKLRCTRERL